MQLCLRMSSVSRKLSPLKTLHDRVALIRSSGAKKSHGTGANKIVFLTYRYTSGQLDDLQMIVVLTVAASDRQQLIPR
uniref:Uncharacterized protein n=1 Tax=Setaria viridis TaxID=4556 RepID=A0A4U6UJF7_SETVI|nr:hypothetical protein SEVIR_5G299300v2 [Setaria viridis]